MLHSNYHIYSNLFIANYGQKLLQITAAYRDSRNCKLLQVYYKLLRKFTTNYFNFTTNYNKMLLQITTKILQITAHVFLQNSKLL